MSQHFHSTRGRENAGSNDPKTKRTYVTQTNTILYTNVDEKNTCINTNNMWETDQGFRFRRRSGGHPNVTVRGRRRAPSPPPLPANVTVRGRRRASSPPPPPPQRKKKDKKTPGQFTVYNDFSPLSVVSLGLVPPPAHRPDIKCPENSTFYDGGCRDKKGKLVVVPLKSSATLMKMR